MTTRTRGLLLDLDGTLYLSGRAIAGAREALEALVAQGFQLRFMTNTSASMPEQIAESLRAYGFAVEPEHVFSPVMAAVRQLRASQARRCLFLVDPAVLGAFDSFERAEGGSFDTVVMGDMGARLSIDLLNRAFRGLRDGAQLIALQKNPFWFGPEGPTLDCGAFVAGLELASGREALVVGKPSPVFFQLAAQSMGLTEREVLVVGDDVTTDIRGAARAGMPSVLLRTGKFSEAALSSVSEQPTIVLGSIAELPSWLATRPQPSAFHHGDAPLESRT